MTHSEKLRELKNILTGYRVTYHPLFGLDIIDLDGQLEKRDWYDPDLSMAENMQAQFGKRSVELVTDLLIG